MAVDLRPTESMAANAKRGLEMRRRAAPSQKGGTAVGVARARDIARRANLSPETVKDMHSFFARHGAQGAGDADASMPQRIAWLLWGGSSGRNWARARVRELNERG